MEQEEKTQYTPRERVVTAYKGGFADRVPAYPIAGSFAGCLDGLSIEEYCTNPTKAAKAMLNYYERYEPDIMIAFNDLAKEAEAIGCHVKYSDYVVPSIDRHVLQDDRARLATLEIPDPKRDGRLPAFLEQCAALSSAKLPSALGAVLVGPWTIAMLMRNPELMCLDTIDDPQFVHELMRFTTEYAKRIGDAVLETGIGLSYSDPTASCSLVGPDTYREFIKPYHKALVDYFKAKKVGTTVHICGTTHQIHEDLVDVGFVAITIDLDQQSDPALKVDQLDRLVTLGNQRGVVAIGNVDVSTFERATQAQAEAAVRTRRIRLGSGILGVWGRSAATIAMAASTLHDISGGRFTLGLGASTAQLAEGLHDVPFSAPTERMRRVITQVRALLKGERIPLAAATGARPLRLNLPPAPAVPIYLAGLAADSIRLAGELADGWIPFLYPRSRLAEGKAILKEGAARTGAPRELPLVCPSMPAVVAADPAEASAGAAS